MHVRARVYACVYVCVRMRVINKNRHHFYDFCDLSNHSPVIYLLTPFNFRHVGFCFSVFVHK